MKRITTVFLIMVLSCTITLPITSDWETVQPDTGQRFRIWQSYINEGGGYRQTTLRVILCDGTIDTSNKIFDEIRVFHDRMNGKSDSLTIYLYRSKKDLLDGHCLSINTYLKENEDDEKEINDRSIDGNDGTCYEY